MDLFFSKFLSFFFIFLEIESVTFSDYVTPETYEYYYEYEIDSSSYGKHFMSNLEWTIEWELCTGSSHKAGPKLDQNLWEGQPQTYT